MKNLYYAAFIIVASGLSISAAQGQTLEPNQHYTWGINNTKAINLNSGQIITEAVLTFHNFKSDLFNTTTVTETTRSSIRGGTITTTTTIKTPNYDSLKVYILANPRFGYRNLGQVDLNEDLLEGYEDPFDGYGGKINPILEQGNLVYRLGSTHDANSPFTKVFNAPVSFLLSNGQSVSLSSALLEFIDYAGTGVSVGFGIWPGSVRYYYDDITLRLTIQTFQGAYEASTLVYHLNDDMNPVEQIAPADPSYTLTLISANGTVTKSPNKASYAHGETVTLIAAANTGYSFANWTGDASGAVGTITITMDGNKTITANYTQNAANPIYTLSLSAINGAIKIMVNGKVATSTSFAADTVVELYAEANSGYKFGGWSGDAAGTINPILIKIDSNKTISAIFDRVVTRSSFR